MEQTTQKSSDTCLLSVRGVCKAFSLNAVLKGIDLNVDSGEVVALIGGNGAGKSVLMKIIMGIHQQDKGDITISGEKITVNKPAVSLAKGIYLVPQEPMLFPNMTVEENITMGFAQKKDELRSRLAELIAQMGWKLDLSRKARSLSIAEQQLVEIMRGLLRDAKVLILDEPTSALTFDEVESLFRVIKDLKEKGIGIIYITHRLNEVFEIATGVAIMRDGVITLNGPIGNFTMEDLVKGLLPPDSQVRGKRERQSAPDYSVMKPVCRLNDFSGYGFSNVTFDVYAGEILGLAGLVGAGRTELATAIFGRDAVKGGTVILNGEDVTGLPTKKIIEKGINYVSEDRYLNGIFRISTVAANTSAACLRDLGRFFLDFKGERNLTGEYIKNFRVKVTGQDQIMGSLSGGNQQKLIIGRAFSTKPKLVILDEPTRGIDAAARGDVYAIINQIKEQGVAVLLISSDMEEIMELSDRAMTMFRGRINHCFDKPDITQDNLMAASFGVYEGRKQA